MMESLSHMDMQWFWGIKQKHMYDHFKNFPIVPGHVVNLSQLMNSHCPLSSYVKAQKMSILFICVVVRFFTKCFTVSMWIFETHLTVVS